VFKFNDFYKVFMVNCFHEGAAFQFCG